jgi:hypothetical protein
VEVPILVCSPFGQERHRALKLLPLCDPPSGEPNHSYGNLPYNFHQNPHKLKWTFPIHMDWYMDHISHDWEKKLEFFLLSASI